MAAALACAATMLLVAPLHEAYTGMATAQRQAAAA
jgi:hypothetical protein